LLLLLAEEVSPAKSAKRDIGRFYPDRYPQWSQQMASGWTGDRSDLSQRSKSSDPGQHFLECPWVIDPAGLTGYVFLIIIVALLSVQRAV